MLTHIVLLKLKEDVKKEAIDNLYSRLPSLKEEIEGIVSISGGTNISPEKKDQGYSEGFVIVFEDNKARDDYLPHLSHQKFIEDCIAPIVDDVLVFDYETKS